MPIQTLWFSGCANIPLEYRKDNQARDKWARRLVQTLFQFIQKIDPAAVFSSEEIFLAKNSSIQNEFLVFDGSIDVASEKYDEVIRFLSQCFADSRNCRHFAYLDLSVTGQPTLHLIMLPT